MKLIVLMMMILCSDLDAFARVDADLGTIGPTNFIRDTNRDMSRIFDEQQLADMPVSGTPDGVAQPQIRANAPISIGADSCLAQAGAGQFTCSASDLTLNGAPRPANAIRSAPQSMDDGNCRAVFGEQFFQNSGSMNLSAIRQKACYSFYQDSDPSTIRVAMNAAEQCVAIYKATEDMTGFQNPGAGTSSATNQRPFNEEEAQTERERLEFRQANEQAERRQNQQGSQVGVNGMNCNGSKFALDYPACKRFVGWYNALQLADAGLQGYNMYQQNEAGQRGLSQAQTGLARGDTSSALAGQQTTIQERAAGFDRTMAFNGARAAAITAQLSTFPNPENLESKCDMSKPCCRVLAGMGNASTYFPNAGMKAMMTAEIARAVGAALAAKLAADAARRQNELVGNIKEQMQDGNTNDPGLINNFCQLNPQDTRCVSSVTGDLPPGTFGSNGFTAGDFGSDSFGLENGAVSDPTLAPTTPDGSGGNVGAIGSVGNEARDAQTTFNTPGQGSSIGAPAAGGGGGGAGGGSAAAPGLSRDPGVQGEQKPADTKVTSLGAAYSGAAYNSSGGGGRGDRKPAAAENPFAQLFGKDKAAAEQAPVLVDPKFELFEAISNRHRTVWERKDLMEVK